MGVIQQQGTKSSIFLLIGFAIGAINTVILFPKVFSQEEFGLTRALIDAATILSSLATLGTLPVIYKFYPFYRSYTKPKENDLPFITALVCITGFALICLTGYIFKDFIIRKLGKSPLFAENFFLVYPFTFLMLAYAWMESFGWSFKKTVITNFLRETAVRVITTILILLAAFGVISHGMFMNFFSLLYLIPVLILFAVLVSTKQWKFNFKISKVTRRLKGKMIAFSLFVFGAGFLNVASKTVDAFMIIGLKGLKETAIFTIASYLVAFMDLPQRSINSIATPVLADSWKDKKYDQIQNIYQKSTITLLVTGLFIFFVVLLCINDLVVFLNADEWSQVPVIVMIMGIAKLIDLGTGVNGLIIGTSINWKFDFWTNVLLTLMAFPLNFFLIKEFGIVGAAISNLVALTIFNAIRLTFIYRKYGWQPYRFVHLKVIFTGLAIFFLVKFIPFAGNIYLDAAIRAIAFGSLYIFLMLRMNVSEEFNSIVAQILKRLKPGSDG